MYFLAAMNTALIKLHFNMLTETAFLTSDQAHFITQSIKGNSIKFSIYAPNILGLLLITSELT
jgi:hypothetical protein